MRRPVDLDLKDHLQTKFDLSRGAQRVDASASTHTVSEMPVVVGTVDATGLAGKQSRHHARRQIEINEVEKVVDANRRLKRHPLLNVVGPGERSVEGLEP